MKSEPRVHMKAVTVNGGGNRQQVSQEILCQQEIEVNTPSSQYNGQLSI